RRCRGRIEQFELVTEHFDLTGLHVRVHRASRSCTHPPLRAKHIFVSYAVGNRKALATIRIEHYLHDSTSVAQIQKDHTAVIAATMHPAAQHDFGAHVRSVEVATVVTTHGR